MEEQEEQLHILSVQVDPEDQVPVATVLPEEQQHSQMQLVHLVEILEPELIQDLKLPEQVV
jgi:hypothetical protein